MCMKTKGRFGHPTMCMKTKVISSRPGRRKGTGLAGYGSWQAIQARSTSATDHA